MAEILKKQAEEEQEEALRVCPYCGQTTFQPEDDPREYCDCDDAIRFRSYVDALEDFCGDDCYKESPEFKPVPEPVMGALREMADFMVRKYFFKIAVELPDGSTLGIGKRIKRAVRVEAEKRVE